MTSSDHLGSKWYMDGHIAHSLSVMSCRAVTSTGRYVKVVCKFKS